MTTIEKLLANLSTVHIDLQPSPTPSRITIDGRPLHGVTRVQIEHSADDHAIPTVTVTFQARSVTGHEHSDLKADT